MIVLQALSLAAKHFQAHAKSWQDTNLAWTDSLSLCPSSHLRSVTTKAKLLWRSIPGEPAEAADLQVARMCTLPWDYSPVCAFLCGAGKEGQLQSTPEEH